MQGTRDRRAFAFAWGLLAEQGGNITEAARFNDQGTNLFFINPQQLTTMGRDAESAVLARAVTWHARHRVLLNVHQTVVFK